MCVGTDRGSGGENRRNGVYGVFRYEAEKQPDRRPRQPAEHSDIRQRVAVQTKRKARSRVRRKTSAQTVLLVSCYAYTVL